MHRLRNVPDRLPPSSFNPSEWKGENRQPGCLHGVRRLRAELPRECHCRESGGGVRRGGHQLALGRKNAACSAASPNKRFLQRPEKKTGSCC